MEAILSQCNHIVVILVILADADNIQKKLAISKYVIQKLTNLKLQLISLKLRCFDIIEISPSTSTNIYTYKTYPYTHAHINTH